MENLPAVTHASIQAKPGRAAGTSRRSFLGTAAGLTGVALAAGAWRPGPGPAVRDAAAITPNPRGGFAFELAGINTGFIRSVDGGAISTDVVVEAAGPTFYQKKHIASVKYEDFDLQVGLSMSRAVYEWINASWTGSPMRKDGAILAADQLGNVRSRREFRQALITETTIPACDAASKDAAYLTLKFAPEFIQTKAGAGKLALGGTAQKSWLAANFRFAIRGLDATKVNKIAAFTVKQPLATDIGGLRDVPREPGRLEFGNLIVTLAEASAATWSAWFDDFVIKGNATDDKERTGVLGFLSPNLTDFLAHIAFFNIGIFKYEEAPGDTAADTIRRVRAHLYYERAEFHLGPPFPEVCLTCVL